MNFKFDYSIIKWVCVCGGGGTHVTAQGGGLVGNDRNNQIYYVVFQENSQWQCYEVIFQMMLSLACMAYLNDKAIGSKPKK